MSEEKSTIGFFEEIENALPPPVIEPVEVVDNLGVRFDPEIHKVDEAGNPKRGSKKQFLLKREAKKTAKQKVKDFFSGKKDEELEFTENQKKPEMPLSDHEMAEKEQAESLRNAEEAAALRKISEVSPASKICAEMTFAGYAAILGGSVYDHRSEFYPRVCQIIHEEELRTGKSMPIPAWAIMPMALAQVGSEIYQKDERCRRVVSEKIELTKKVIFKNEVKKSIFQRFRKPQEQAEVNSDD